jgi:hypothetical protein
MLTQKRAKVALLLGVLAALLAALPLIIYAEGITAWEKHPAEQAVKLAVLTSKGTFTALSAEAAPHGSLAGSPRSEYTAGSRTGSIQQSRSHLDLQGPFNDLLGATYDQETGELILYGLNSDLSLPPISDGALTVALRTRYDLLADPKDHWPGVTIEFSRTNPSLMDVIYFGKVRDTRFGYVLFESDRLLKYYGLGYDNSTGVAVPITSTVPGYKSELACLSERGYAPPSGRPIQWRKWFSPTLSILATEDDTAIAFDQARMTLNWAYDSSTTSRVVDQCVQAFVDHFNAHYQDFANEQQARENPVLHELPQLAKITAVAEWLQSRELDSEIAGLNYPWLSRIPVPYHDTPSTTPRISVTVGSLIQSGGVDLHIPPRSFVPDTGWAADLARAALQSRPSPSAKTWQFPCHRLLAANGAVEFEGLTQEQCQVAALRVAYNQIKEDMWHAEGSVAESSQSPREGARAFRFFGPARLSIRVPIPRFATRSTLFYWWGHVRPKAAMLTSKTDLQPSQLEPWQAFPKPIDLDPRAPGRTTANDFLYVHLIPAQGPPVTLQTISDEDEEGTWTPSPGFDLSPFIGQEVQLEFVTQMGSSDPTNFFIGAVELNADAPPPTPTPTATTTPSPTPTVAVTPGHNEPIFLSLIMRNFSPSALPPSTPTVGPTVNSSPTATPTSTPTTIPTSTPTPVPTAAPILLRNDNGDPAGFNSDWEAGDIIGAVFDVDPSLFPLRILSARFPLYRDFPGAANSAQVSAYVYSMPDGTPDELIGSSGVETVSSFYPTWRTIDLASQDIVLDTPVEFMMALKYEAGSAGSTPSIITDSNENIPPGSNFYSEDGGATWREHYDFWESPAQAGYNMIRVLVTTGEGHVLNLQQGLSRSMVTELRRSQEAGQALCDLERR